MKRNEKPNVVPLWPRQPEPEDPVTPPSPPRAAAKQRRHDPGAQVTVSGERLTLNVEEAAALLGISRTHAYEAVRLGHIRCVRIGQRILIPRAELERLINIEHGGRARCSDEVPPERA